MAPPPAKKQKRLVFLSSDDDEDWAPTTEGIRGRKASSEPSNWSDAHGTTKRSLPTRSRKEPTDYVVNVEASAVTNLTPSPSPKKPTRKTKPTARPQVSKPISSFFNATSHSQQVNGYRQPNAETPELENDEEDLIEDDSVIEDVNELRGQQGTTRFVLDRRKARFASAQTVPPSTQLQRLASSSQRFKIPGSAIGKRNDLPNAVDLAPKEPDERPWAERFGPSNLEELAVHKRKILDVRNWLENVLQWRDHKRLLILRGPSGTGKTATIATLAKAMDLELSEWRNPVGSEFSSEGYHSMSAQFEEFLGRSGKFRALSLTDSTGDHLTVPSPTTITNSESTRRKVILLEEFPNTFLSTSSALRSFRSSILEYLAINTPSVGALFSKQGAAESITPVVMVITETRLSTTTAASDSFTAHRLLGSEILSHPGVSFIDFNPIASTYLIKALDLVVQKEARHSRRQKTPGPSVLKKLGEVGDIRSAIGSLEFLCLRGEDSDDWGGRVAFKAKKSVKASSAFTKMESESLEMVTQRESSLGLFHAVGKVVYNKRDDLKAPLPQLPDHPPQQVSLRISQVSVDQLIDETGTDTAIFVAALHENYALSCEGTHFIDTLNGCLDALSDSDLLSVPPGGRFGSNGYFGGRSFQGAASDTLRQDEICFQIAVRGLLFALPDPVKRRAHPIAGKSGSKNDTYKMFYPTSARLSRQMEEIEGLLDAWSERLRVGVKPSVRLGGNVDEHETTDPIRTSLSCTKSEILLERLPFITKIEQGNPTSSRLSELEKITQFHGVGAPNEDVSDDENADEVGPAMAWATDRPADGKSESSGCVATVQRGVIQGGKEASTFVLPVEEDAGKLYLSDDDIEDD